MLQCPNQCDEGLQVVLTRRSMVPVSLGSDAKEVHVTSEALYQSKNVVYGSPFLECGGCGFEFNLEVVVR